VTEPSNDPRAGARRGGERRPIDPRVAEPRMGDRNREPRGGDPLRRRRASAPDPAPPPRAPFTVRHATRIRWVTWIGVLIIAIRLIAPRPDGWRRWSDAEQALADVGQARTAALLYYQSAGRTWPAPGRPGVVPAGMLPFLPGEVSFARPRYKLTWEYAADTLSGARVIGVSVAGDDPKLALAMAQRAPQGMPFIVSGRRFVALIASASGR
jgi:hypothetical protein